MDNFDLRKYLAEGKLYEETEDVYGDGDVVVDITGMTPNQKAVWEIEKEISEFGDSTEAQVVVDDIKKLNTPEDVKRYYIEDRGMDIGEEGDLINHLVNKFK